MSGSCSKMCSLSLYLSLHISITVSDRFKRHTLISPALSLSSQLLHLADHISAQQKIWICETWNYRTIKTIDITQEKVPSLRVRATSHCNHPLWPCKTEGVKQYSVTSSKLSFLFKPPERRKNQNQTWPEYKFETNASMNSDQCMEYILSCVSWQWWCGWSLCPRWPGQHRIPRRSDPCEGTGSGSWLHWCWWLPQTCSHPFYL